MLTRHPNTVETRRAHHFTAHRREAVGRLKGLKLTDGDVLERRADRFNLQVVSANEITTVPPNTNDHRVGVGIGGEDAVVDGRRSIAQQILHGGAGFRVVQQEVERRVGDGGVVPRRRLHGHAVRPAGLNRNGVQVIKRCA